MTTRSQIINKEDNIPYINEIKKMILATRCLPPQILLLLSSDLLRILLLLSSELRAPYVAKLLGFCFAFVQLTLDSALPSSESIAPIYYTRADSTLLYRDGWEFDLTPTQRLIRYTNYSPYTVENVLNRRNLKPSS